MSGSYRGADRRADRLIGDVASKAIDSSRKTQDLSDRTTVLEYFCRLVEDGTGPLAHGGNNLLRFCPDGLYVACGDVADCATGAPTGGPALRFDTVVIAAADTDLRDASVDLISDGGDDRFLFQDALELLPVTGGTIVCLEGTYNFTDGVTTQLFIGSGPPFSGNGGGYENVRIIGMGPGTVLDMSQADSDSILFYVDADYPDADGQMPTFELANLKVKGAGYIATGFEHTAVTQYFGKVTIVDCWFHNCGVDLNDYGGILDKCYFTGDTRIPVYAEYYGVIVRNNHFGNGNADEPLVCENCLYISSDQVTVDGNVLDNVESLYDMIYFSSYWGKLLNTTVGIYGCLATGGSILYMSTSKATISGNAISQYCETQGSYPIVSSGNTDCMNVNNVWEGIIGDDATEPVLYINDQYGTHTNNVVDAWQTLSGKAVVMDYDDNTFDHNRIITGTVEIGGDNNRAAFNDLRGGASTITNTGGAANKFNHDGSADDWNDY